VFLRGRFGESFSEGVGIIFHVDGDAGCDGNEKPSSL
jgi:hypothetical protein